MIRILSSSKWAFVLTGIYTLACIPAILLAERVGWSQRPFHFTQIIAAFLCFLAGGVFLWNTRGSRFGVIKWLATAALVLCCLFLAFVAYVLATFDLSGLG